MSTIPVTRTSPAFNDLLYTVQAPVVPAPAAYPTASAEGRSSPPANAFALPQQWRREQKSRFTRGAAPQVTPPLTVSVKPTRRFPASDVATPADVTLQANVVHWLNTRIAPDKPIPANASIAPFVEMYNEVIQEPAMQAWFKAKGLKLSTVRVFSDSVVGSVTRDGKDTFQRFTTTDGSGWWEVSAMLRAIHTLLSPSDLGIPVVPGPTQEAVPLDVVLDFYGVKPPRNERAAPQLGEKLQREGWPQISSARRAQWGKQFKQLQQNKIDRAVRERLGRDLEPLIKDKQDGATLKLDEQAIAIEPESSLDQLSESPRKQFVEFLASAPFQAFLQKSGLAGVSREYRLSEGELQLLSANGRWISLQEAFDDEVEQASGHGSEGEQIIARKMNEDFDLLVQNSEKTGNALYNTPRYDARQALAFYTPDVPQTVGHVRAALGWLNTQLAPPALAGDYASMTPYGPTAGTLSASALETMTPASAGVMSLLKAFPAAGSVSPSVPDPDRQLVAFFDSPQAIAKADEIAKALKLYSVAEGQALPRAERHQLLATALKLSIGTTVPGAQGQVAGYALYQPGNLGRSIKEVRGDVEKQLEGKGVDAALSPLMAHLFLAQSAPEMLVKADPGVPAGAARALNQDPQNIKIGSTGWLELRQGCAIADTLSGPGSSRLMNLTQIMALSRLEASGPNQETLLKSLAVKPLLDWAVLAGVFPPTRDGQYSPGDYQAAAQAFTQRENQVREAFATLTKEPPSQTSILVKQLALLFPEMTEQEISAFKLELDTDVEYDPRQHAHLETRQPLLTDVILTNQVEGDPLLAVDKWFNNLVSGEKKYKFIHPKISQATFEQRIERLPRIEPLVAPTVDQHIAQSRAAQATMLKQMFAQLPLEDRKGLELGKIEFFTVREATGDAMEDDKGPDSNVAKKIGTHGLLLRYETGAVEPRFGYYEVFPGSMQMVKRTDLRDPLLLGGETKVGQKAHGPFAYVRRPFQKGTEQPFDFEAYRTGSPPRPNTKSTVIVEKSTTVLPATSQVATQRVPNTFVSNRTGQIVDTLMAHSFEGKRDALIEYANEPTKLHSRRTYPFTSGKVFSAENARMILSLIPFVGAISDIAQGNVAAGLKGLVIDFAAFTFTGGWAGARRFFSSLKMLVPFVGRSFSMSGLKGAGTFFRSLFNPLDGAIDVLATGPRAMVASRKILMGEFARVGPGLYMPAIAFEKCRWAMGVKDTAISGVPPSAGQWPGARFGTSQNRELYAVQNNGLWYAVSPTTCRPEGPPLVQFTPQPG